MKGLSHDLRIDYTDDGRGIDPRAAATGGIGLQNINERTASLRGRFQLNNNFPNGYTVELSIPLL
jgi:signal transduction histidine kinase